MATIRRITPSGGISDFRPSAPEAGGGFRLLAGALGQVYDMLEPIAIREETEKGAALGREIAKQQIGGEGGQVFMSSSGGSPGDPRYRDAIASIESAGSGDYAAVGPTNAKLGRALGRYQIMEANIGPWSREALGREVTADEFMANPAIQDAIFDHKFGSYVAQFGEAGAAQAWFAGPGGVGKTGRKDVLGTTVGAYGEKFLRALGAGPTITASSSGSDVQPAFAPTMIRQADGKLVAKLYNPSSSPIMQAHNLAASADYQSQIFLKSAADMMGLREQFSLNPDAFMQAAGEYVESIVENAPDMFRGDIRAGLEKEVQQTFLGILDDKNRDIRERASNSNAALIDRYSDNLASAVAGGDPTQIAAARAELTSALQLREQLPGVSWTPEQSYNSVLKAEEEGQRRIQTAQDEQVKGWKKTLGTIVDAAKKGLTAAGEELLDNPQVAALLPDDVREALAFTTLRDQMPSFQKMPPAQQAAAIAEMKAQPVTEKWEADLIGTAEEAQKANAKAWKEDPIQRASEVLDIKPPPLPALDPNNPQAFIDGLAARGEYARGLRDQGYSPFLAFFTNEEAVQMGALMSKDNPPEMRAAAASAFAMAFGGDAMSAMKEVKVDDPVTLHAGQMIAAGQAAGSADLIVSGTLAFKGQTLVDEGLVQLPDKAKSIAAVSGDIFTAVTRAYGGEAGLGDVMKTAVAIYAATAPANTSPSSPAAQKYMETALQMALGQGTNKKGDTTGGVQEVLGKPTLMPVGVAGADLEAAMEAAMSPVEQSAMEAFGSIWGGAPAVDMALWQSASGGQIPTVDGEPIDAGFLRRHDVVLTPVRIEGNDSTTLYMLSVDNNGQIQDVRAGATGAPFIFDAQTLIDETAP